MLPKPLPKSIIGERGSLLFSPKSLNLFGERAGTRTQDLLIKSQLLYRLSYALVTLSSRMTLPENRSRIMRQEAV